MKRKTNAYARMFITFHLISLSASKHSRMLKISS